MKSSALFLSLGMLLTCALALAGCAMEGANASDANVELNVSKTDAAVTGDPNKLCPTAPAAFELNLANAQPISIYGSLPVRNLSAILNNPKSECPVGGVVEIFNLASYPNPRSVNAYAYPRIRSASECGQTSGAMMVWGYSESTMTWTTLHASSSSAKGTWDHEQQRCVIPSLRVHGQSFPPPLSGVFGPDWEGGRFSALRIAASATTEVEINTHLPAPVTFYRPDALDVGVEFY